MLGFGSLLLTRIITPAVVQISLEILDVNDNAPVFPVAVVRHSMSESSPVGSALTVSPATDLDTVQFGVVGYQLRDVTGTATRGGATDNDGDECTTLPHFHLAVNNGRVT